MSTSEILDFPVSYRNISPLGRTILARQCILEDPTFPVAQVQRTHEEEESTVMFARYLPRFFNPNDSTLRSKGTINHILLIHT